MGQGLKIVLASTSPRRRQLIGMLGLPFQVVDPGEVEETSEGEPAEVVLLNAMAKARSVVDSMDGELVISADTIVVKDGVILGKPFGPGEAWEMLMTLRGAWHRVYTGIVVWDTGSGRVESDVVETDVKMRPLSEGEIANYIASGEPLDKAGGYAVQGLGAILVEEVRGCFYNVVGLPLSHLSLLLRKLDVRLL